MKNSKKKYLHRQKKKEVKPEQEIIERINLFPEPSRTKLLADFKEASQDKTLLKFEKKYKKTVFFDFYAMLYAAVFVGDLKKLRKLKNKSAQDIDRMLGYTIGYPMASLKNTLNNPTEKNVRITFAIYKRMAYLNNSKPFSQIPTDELIDVNEIFIRALTMHGYEIPTEVDKETLENSETNQDKEKMQEENEMIETYELVINGEIVFFDKENSALDLLKKIKEQTNIEVEVFETIKEQLI